MGREKPSVQIQHPTGSVLLSHRPPVQAVWSRLWTGPPAVKPCGEPSRQYDRIQAGDWTSIHYRYATGIVLHVSSMSKLAGMDTPSQADEVVVRVDAAAGLALVRRPNGSTRWIFYDHVQASTITEDGVIDLHEAAEVVASPPSIDLHASDFGPQVVFEVIPSADGLLPQNLVVFLHGRGDSHVPFARLGAQMALPQTAVLSLRAPLELPFDMGHTWIHDLDDDYSVIPLTAPHPRRSTSLDTTRDFVASFLSTLRDNHRWRMDRVFLFGFSQGASIAYHVAATLPWRLGGVVLVAGGIITGPHQTPYASQSSDHETPALLIGGSHDQVFPPALAATSEHVYNARFKGKPLLTRHTVPHKTHDMVRSEGEMRVIMEFFSRHLFLRDVALEHRSDLIEITASRR